MEGKKQRALVTNQYGKLPTLAQDWDIPTLKQGQLLVKVEASTINPSDRMFVAGSYFKKPLPAVCGLQGTGTVIQAKGQFVQSWVGKRVCFAGGSGSWANYTVTSPITTFEIDKDVPLQCAASGIVNPLTVIGFVQHSKTLGSKGIIHTAAASALGRQLNKLCQSKNIPLLNIVRRKQHAQLLKKQGAKHVIVTQGEWVNQLKQLIKTEGFDCVFDALGGGPVTEAIVCSLSPKSIYHLYGVLQAKPFTITNPSVLFSGITITGFLLTPWWIPTSQQTKKRIRSEYSSLLKNQLATHTYKQFSLKQIQEALELSVKKSTEGKILLKIE